MFLCKICNSGNGSAFSEGSCGICGDAALETDSMIAEASTALEKESIGSFSISTVLPKDWLINEEKVWDVRIRGAESVKSLLNHRIVAGICKATGLVYESDGDCRVVFDYSDKCVSLQRNDLFIFGRYRKLVPGLSQSRWLCQRCQGKGCQECDGKGKNYESVEERIGEPVIKATQATEYVMHASGREDVDATNSAGRAFVLQIMGPRIRKPDLDSIASEIAASSEVQVIDLRIVERGFCEIVTESHFDKAYMAEVEFGRDLATEDAGKIKALEGKTVLQQTPTRVAHRRADLVRHRRIKHIETVNIIGNKATLIVTAEAGTYIKELISGDKGRTKPNVASELGTSARCTKLEVTMIDDGFLDFCLDR